MWRRNQRPGLRKVGVNVRFLRCNASEFGARGDAAFRLEPGDRQRGADLGVRIQGRRRLVVGASLVQVAREQEGFTRQDVGLLVDPGIVEQRLEHVQGLAGLAKAEANAGELAASHRQVGHQRDCLYE